MIGCSCFSASCSLSSSLLRHILLAPGRVLLISTSSRQVGRSVVGVRVEVGISLAVPCKAVENYCIPLFNDGRVEDVEAWDI